MLSRSSLCRHTVVSKEFANAAVKETEMSRARLKSRRRSEPLTVPRQNSLVDGYSGQSRCSLMARDNDFVAEIPDFDILGTPMISKDNISRSCCPEAIFWATTWAKFLVTY
jgi:hypothetical protein